MTLPFIDSEGRPKVSSFIWHEPVGGKFTDRCNFNGIPLGLFQPNGETYSSWAIILTPDRIKCKHVKVGPGEGIMPFCDKVVLVTSKTIGGLYISPLIRAGTEMMTRARLSNAPSVERGGYLKTDFEVEWDDGTTYSGRFDLQKNGLDNYESLYDSLRSRLLFYSGLYCPSHIKPNDYYKLIGNVYETVCHHILGKCEI